MYLPFTSKILANQPVFTVKFGETWSNHFQNKLIVIAQCAQNALRGNMLYSGEFG
jgi:hypothetical protein